MQGNDRKGNGKRATIDHWETLRVLHSDSRPVGRDGDLGVVIEVQRPVFEGERTGRSTMGMVIRRGERMLRLICRNGDSSEISALRDMLAGISDEVLHEYAEEYESIQAKNDPPLRERPSERGSFQKRGATGLGQFSPPGKTARKRENKAKRARGEAV